MTDTVIDLLSAMTLASNVFVAVFVPLLFIKPGAEVLGRVKSFFFKYNKQLALLVAFVATSGSLFLSEVAKFTPCTFCWYQRIFMYPLVFLLATAIIKKLPAVTSYVLPISITGLLLAAYHYYMQLAANPLAPCSAIGFSVSCTERFFTHYGYITIPFMSLSSFFLITIFMLLPKLKK